MLISLDGAFLENRSRPTPFYPVFRMEITWENCFFTKKKKEKQLLLFSIFAPLGMCVRSFFFFFGIIVVSLEKNLSPEALECDWASKKEKEKKKEGTYANLPGTKFRRKARRGALVKDETRERETPLGQNVNREQYRFIIQCRQLAEMNRSRGRDGGCRNGTKLK